MTRIMSPITHNWPRVWMFICAVFFAVLSGNAMADIDNTATASATYGGDPVVSEPSTQAVLVTEGVPAVQLTKTIDNVEDVNGNGLTDAGDIVQYRFEILNSGNLTLETVEISDPLVTIETTTVGPLLPAAVDATLTATYELTQDDVDFGGFENSATALAAPAARSDGTERDPTDDVSDVGDETEETPNLAGETDGDPTNDPTVLIIEQLYELELAKTFVEAINVFPYVFDVTYEFQIDNTGTVTANNLQMTDDLFNELSNATVLNGTITSMSGFTGEGTANPDFDGNVGGVGDATMFTGPLSMAPGDTALVTLVARLQFAPDDFGDDPVELINQAGINADGFDQPVQSYDPDLSDPDKTIPTIAALADLDGDGVPDNLESFLADRDGDGISDAEDYDPTGYFYCEESGEIIPGGSITVLDSFGSNANVVVVHDGTSGYFQWYATATGTYTATYTLPAGHVPSVDRLVSTDPLVLATLTANPTSLGSNEFGSTGFLADFTLGANPFYETFVIAEHDPHVLNVNISVRFCSTPVFEATKVLSSDPVIQPDGRSAISYTMTLSNTGLTRADNVNLNDDLAEAFGLGRTEVVSVTVTDAPAGFGATANAEYNGETDLALLAGDGDLWPDDTVTVELSLLVDPAKTATYTNTVTGVAVHPRDGTIVAPSEASADVKLNVFDLKDVLLITKSATPDRGRIGDVISYTITVENTAEFPLKGLTLVDVLPQGLSYRPATATLDGVAAEPNVSGLTLRWRGLEFAAGQTIVAELMTTLNSRAEVGNLTNQAWVASTVNGDRVTEIAEATVTLIAEAIFHCGDVIGRVFDDRNMNGYQDNAPDLRAAITNQEYQGGKFGFEPVEQTPLGAEVGLPNARLVTPTGTVITTDDFGRYSVPCAELPRRAGSNFTLKLDERSLPNGYRMTTENPRTLRITPGIFTEMNFGAAEGRLVEIDLTAAAFTANGAPSEALANGLERLLAQVAETPSALKLNYYRDGEAAKVGRERLDVAEELIMEIWSKIGNYELIIERSVARFE